MIDELHIHGLGVIEDAGLTLAPGLTVVTGETGAGKTMVVTALQLLLGARGDSDLVRSGAGSARVEAIVRPVPPSADGWVDGEGELILSRELRSGGSRARINGRLAPVGALAEVLGPHVEVHAQHQQVRLGRAEVQRTLLDAYAGQPHARSLERYREAYGAWRSAQDRLHALTTDAQERARELDRLRFELDEIAAAAIDPEVDRGLDDQLETYRHADELRAGFERAVAALGADGALEPVGVAVDALRRLPGATAEALRARLDEVMALLSELGSDVRVAADEVDADPERLEALEQRRHDLRGLQRKYGPSLDDVLAYEREAVARVDALASAETESGELAGTVVALEQAVSEAAEDVRRGRVQAGEQLASAVAGHLAELGMPHATLEVRVSPDAPAAHGADQVEMLLAANLGEPARPLATAASGGERSRVSLALSVAVADVDDVSVLVFDEVDAGVGGATAMAVGEKLARLAAGGARQVICVTHLAQLAAFADVHHVVEKGIRDGRTVTLVRRVAVDDRPAELSRMLGGEAGDIGIAHARELIDEATRRRAG